MLTIAMIVMLIIISIMGIMTVTHSNIIQDYVVPYCMVHAVNIIIIILSLLV